MNEAETRAEHIDPALAAAGWGVVEGSRIRREYPITLGRLEGHGRRGKPLIADYVLIYRNTKLAVVEAKAWDEPLTLGVAQAKDYAEKLAIRFAFSTNGQGIYGIEMQEGTEGEVTRYPTPDELWNRTFAQHNAWRDRFATIPFEDRGGYYQSRYYQDIAIERVMEAIADGRDRILLTLATGTGKTHLLTALGYRACEQGISVRFTRVIDMINVLTTAQINGTLEKALRAYVNPSLLLLDELGYLPIDKRGADLMFQVVAARYESGSIVLTTNRVFRDWGKIFDVDNTLATAMIDRLMHHGEAIVIRGDSYRMKDKGPEPDGE